VIHSGNYEIIGIRHRETQTLYITPLIIPHSSIPSYGKIQVGLYIAAIRDAIDRVQQDMKKEEEQKAEASKLGPSKDDQDKDPDEYDDNDELEEPKGKRRKGDLQAKYGKSKGGPSTGRRRGRST
jgi:hypothetical protein